MLIEFETTRLKVRTKKGLDLGHAVERDGAWDFVRKLGAPAWTLDVVSPRGYARLQDILDDLDWCYRRAIAKDPEGA